MRSPTVAGGYLNRPDLERSAFRDGWYRSGDLGRIDAAGRLHVLGRAADAFPAGERLLTPTRIEDVLCGMSAVRYAVVMPDPVAGTWIAAVEAWADTAIDPGLCVQAVAAAYGPAIARRLRIYPVSQVPRSAQGKPNRDAILELGHAFHPET